MASDLGLALRNVRRRWFVYAALILLLSAATSANLILFSIEDALLFRPLKVERPQDVVLIRSRFAISVQEPTPVSAGQVEALAAADLASVQAVAGVGAGRPCRVTADSGPPVDTICTPVTPGFFNVIGTTGLRGRGFRNDDLRESFVPVVISASFARRVQSSGDSPMGITLRLQGTFDGADDPALRVVGVAPEGFHLPENTQIWLPEIARPGSINAHLAMWARLRPGATLEAARRELSARGFKDWHGDPLDLEPLGPQLVGEGRSSVLLLFVASTVLLLLAWLHGLNVLGMRLSGVRHEIATRFALGASTWRVTRQYGVEGVLVGGVSIVAGLVATYWLLPAVVDVLPATARRHVTFDWAALVWAAAILLIGSAFFMAGTWRLVRGCAERSLHTGASCVSAGRSRTLEAAQAATVAGSMAVVYVAAVLALALGRTYWTSPGFEPRQLLHLLVLPPQAIALSEEDTASAFGTLKREFLRLPAVTRVSRAEGGPATGWNIRGLVSSVGGGDMAPRTVTARIKSVDEGYFPALGVSIVHGRGFVRGQDQVNGRSAVVNVSLARRLWPDAQALGRTVRIADDTYDVIGVCADFRDGALLAPPSPQIYRYADWGFELLVRVQGDPGPVLETLSGVVQTQLPGASVRARTYRQEYWEETASHRARAVSMGGIAVVAMFSAVLGLLADLLHQLAARRRVLGVVLALGASRRQAFLQLFGRTVRWTCSATVAGLGFGLAGAVAAVAVLPDTRAWEPGAVLASLLVVGVAAGLAIALPLLRINPGRVADALREE